MRNAAIAAGGYGVRVKRLDVIVGVVAFDPEEGDANAEHAAHFHKFDKRFIQLVALVGLLDCCEGFRGNRLPVVDGKSIPLADCIARRNQASLVDKPMLRHRRRHLIPDKALRAVPHRLNFGDAYLP